MGEGNKNAKQNILECPKKSESYVSSDKSLIPSGKKALIPKILTFLPCMQRESSLPLSTWLLVKCLLKIYSSSKKLQIRGAFSPKHCRIILKYYSN